MHGGRRWLDSGAVGELPGWQGQPSGQRIQHRRSRRISDEHSDGRQVAITVLITFRLITFRLITFRLITLRLVIHDITISQERFVSGRNIPATPWEKTDDKARRSLCTARSRP
jgi:hypothetical protein